MSLCHTQTQCVAMPHTETHVSLLCREGYILVSYLLESLVQFAVLSDALLFAGAARLVVLLVAQLARLVLHRLSEYVVELHTADDLVAVVDEAQFLQPLYHAGSVEVVAEVGVVQTVVLEVEWYLFGARGLEHVVVVSRVVWLSQVGCDECLGGTVYLGEGGDFLVFVQCLIHFGNFTQNNTNNY